MRSRSRTIEADSLEEYIKKSTQEESSHSAQAKAPSRRSCHRMRKPQISYARQILTAIPEAEFSLESDDNSLEFASMTDGSSPRSLTSLEGSY
mmetsp:Transcript_35607/g.32085  ORF Transcript_35607/g.32085 Transcript_35607/m.32085 type:complete len:93 (-) Transcript_35607:501-779(-)